MISEKKNQKQEVINISFSYKWEEGLWYLQYGSRKQITRNKIRKGQWLSENDAAALM